VPELPEVETIRRQLDPLLTGRSFGDAWAFPHPKFEPALEAAGATVTGLDRRGKYLLVGLDDDRELVVHLGMTGSLQIRPLADAQADPYVRAWWELAPGLAPVAAGPVDGGALPTAASAALRQRHHPSDATRGDTSLAGGLCGVGLRPTRRPIAGAGVSGAEPAGAGGDAAGVGVSGAEPAGAGGAVSGAEPAGAGGDAGGSGSVLAYRDVRRFGRLAVVPKGRYLGTLAVQGPDALDPELVADELWRALRPSQRAVKTQLLSQRPLAGVGNIYADEALWLAGIHPRRRRVSRAQAAKLLDALREVLTAGLDNGGTTFRDYRSATGDRGRNQERLACYGRAGLPCLRCGTTLRRTVLDGRSTTWCPVCQPR
jgi:formamidopyrimidine-DNA glycosylase